MSIPLNSAVTVSFWNNAAAVAGSGSAFTIGNLDTPNRCQAHAPYSDGVLYWDYGDFNVGGRISTSYASYASKWTHVGLVSSGTAATFQGIYLNGALKASQAFSTGPTGAVSGGFVGKFTTMTENGSIAHFAVWTVRLTAGEIAELAAGATPTLIRPASLIVYYPLWGVSTTEADLSGGARNGTVTGTTVVGGPPVGGYAPYRVSGAYATPTVTTPVRPGNFMPFFGL